MEWENIVKAIQDVIIRIRMEYVINNTIIRDDVFGILEKYCTVLYYPLDDEKNCGFHIKKLVKDVLKDFVYINTAKPIETQVFTAAHELGHIWGVAEEVWEKVGCEEDLCKDLEEDITNRFAAELLMPKDIFITTFMTCMQNIGIDKSNVKVDDLIKIVAMQMSEFLVPYEAVRKRMHETNIIGDSVRDYLKKNQDSILEKIAIYSKDQNSRLEKETRSKTIPGIRILIEKAEANKSLDQYMLKKIKRDFNIQDVDTEDDVLEIHLGESQDGKDGSIG